MRNNSHIKNKIISGNIIQIKKKIKNELIIIHDIN